MLTRKNWSFVSAAQLRPAGSLPSLGTLTTSQPQSPPGYYISISGPQFPPSSYHSGFILQDVENFVRRAHENILRLAAEKLGNVRQNELIAVLRLLRLWAVLEVQVHLLVQDRAHHGLGLLAGR